MFQLDVSPYGKFSSRRYYTEDNSISFTVIPESGALLTDFQYHGHPIIDGCRTAEEVEFNDWGKSWLLFPFPNRLKDGSYTWQEKNYQFPINETQNQHALHGFLHECAFEVVAEEVSEQFSSVQLAYQYEGERAYYPFPFLFQVTYRADLNGNFTVECRIENSGSTPLPFGLGWHPYFQLGAKVNDLSLQMPAADLVGIDSRMIPTGKTYTYDKFAATTPINAEVLDNCFLLKSTTETQTVLSDAQLKITFRQPTNDFPYQQIFTPPMRQSVAIEPMTCNVDAFNNGNNLMALAPQKSWKGKFGFTVESL